ncbi:MAG: glycosyltransferase N-terminal domain-containing protein [Candidatus Neomarinimicrobiota bacterium]
MYWVWRLVYNLLILPVMVLTAYLLVPVHRKFRRGLRGRRRSLERVAEFRDSRPDLKGLLYWFHVASHGEYEQTRPVIEGLREVSPSAIIVVSFFSPSGYENFDHDAVDFKFYLPLDFPWKMRRLLKILRPHRVVIASYDLWPNLIWACNQARIPTTLFAARIVPSSTKHLPVVSNFYKHLYGAIAHVYTVSDADHRRVQALLGAKSKTVVKNLGNPRYDRVLERSSNGLALGPNSEERVIILGSLHREDDIVVAETVIDQLRHDPKLHVIWAPHEPEPEVLEAIENRLTEAGISWERFGRRFGRFRDHQVLVIDGVGYLAETYSRGILAYVGGGFGSGVHNLMEPAIAGIPVIFGPHHNRSHEAEQLIEYGGGISVSNTEEFQTELVRFITDEDARRSGGAAAMKVIEDNLGAAGRILHAIIGE